MISAYPDSRGTCVRVDLHAIAHNVRAIRRELGEQVQLMAVVKANAYGHGLIPVAQTALQNGASCLAVAMPEEGRRLREAGVQAPILVLGNVTAAGAEISVREGLIQTVFDPAGVRCLQNACARQNQPVQVHLKLDTGMGRIGARDADEVRAALAALADAPLVRLTGAFTHFADADNPDDSFSREQFARFMRLTEMLPAGLTLHAAASDASLRFPWARLNMVREGIAIYGCPTADYGLHLRPAMQLETRVSYVKAVAPGDTVGYGRAFLADRPLRVATLPVGYGDGYTRACSGRASVLLHGQLCPVLGRVCMDQMMVDVSHVPDVAAGDTAVLMGSQQGASITPQQLAEWAGTICYEIMLSPHARVPVIYEDEETKGKNANAE